MMLNWIKAKAFIKNPYLYGLMLILLARFILYASGFPTIFYANSLLKILPLDGYLIDLLELSSFIFISLFVIVCARILLRLSWKTLGMTRKAALKEFLKGWGFGAIVLVMCVAIMMLVGVARIESITFNSTLIWQFFPLFIVWSIQGNAEELLTRTLLFAGIARKLNMLAGIIVSALFFTAIHLGNNGIEILPLIDLFIFGVFAALLMIKTKNIWVISGYHAAWNCFQGNVFAFPVSGTYMTNYFIQVSTQGPSFLSGGEFGVEGSVISILIQTLMVGWLCYDLFVKGELSIFDKFDIEDAG